MFPDITKQDYLIINGIPIFYWIYKISTAADIFSFLLLGVGILNILILFYYRNDIVYKLKSGLTTKEFAIFIRERPLFMIGAILCILYCPGSWLLMILDDKNYFIWTLIILWLITFLYFMIMIQKPRYKNKLNQIKNHILNKK